MKNRTRHISQSLLLMTFLGCSTGGVLLVDNAVQPQYANAQVVDEGYFYSNLAPHGEWFFQADFGWVWHPTRIGVGWRPYTEGQWVWAEEYGWVWASDEPWGWATYHYGRWYFDPIYGWSWVPGNEWAPAWVSWRVESSYIGWAPLWPVWFDIYPEYRWNRWHHDHDWDRRHHGRDWDRWVFTRDRDFMSPRVGRHSIRDRRERDRIFEGSRDVTRWDGDRSDQIGRSIDRSRIERAVGRPIKPIRLEATDRPRERQTPEGDRLPMFRPRIQEQPDKTPDRMGLVKERQPAPRDTLRQEKERLDRVAPKERTRAEGEVREKDTERGGAPATVDRRERVGRGGRAAGEIERGPAPAGREGRAVEETPPGGDRQQDRPGRIDRQPQQEERQRDQQGRPERLDREPQGAPGGRQREPEAGKPTTRPEAAPRGQREERPRGKPAETERPEREPAQVEQDERIPRGPSGEPRGAQKSPGGQPRESQQIERESRPDRVPPPQQERMQRSPSQQDRIPAQQERRPQQPQQRMERPPSQPTQRPPSTPQQKKMERPADPEEGPPSVPRGAPQRGGPPSQGGPSQGPHGGPPPRP